jgi:PucR family transcriptional regulator, purine catabolism regulatory protein
MLSPLPTVADILSLPVLAAGGPELVGGAAGLGNPVRWVHVSELPDIAGLLSGRELLLTTGIALATDPASLHGYVRTLAEAGVSGLVIELGRAFRSAPAALREAAEHHRLPVVVLRREVRFVRVTEAAHELIIDSQLDELRAGQEIHDTFTELALDGAEVSEIVRRGAATTGRPLLFEDLRHQVLCYETATLPAEALLDAWAGCTRELPGSGRTRLVTDGAARSWLVTPVGARGEVWGRLAMLTEGAARPRHWTVMDRAAVAIAMGRLIERDQQTLERHGHRSLLADILGGGHPARDLETRAWALGVPLAGRTLIGCVVRLRRLGRGDGAGARDRELGERVAQAAREVGAKALVGFPARGSVAALLSSPGPAQRELQRFAGSVHRLLDGAEWGPVVMAAGSEVDAVRDARRSMREAEQVAETIGESDPPKPCYQLPDVRIRGLMHVLRDDARVQTFCERELGRLLRHDRQHGTDLRRVLETYLSHGLNKSETARELGLSRPALYARLTRISFLLGVDLESPESCLSLHVALLGMSELTPAPPAAGRAPGGGP